MLPPPVTLPLGTSFSAEGQCRGRLGLRVGGRHIDMALTRCEYVWWWWGDAVHRLGASQGFLGEVMFEPRLTGALGCVGGGETLPPSREWYV